MPPLKCSSAILTGALTPSAGLLAIGKKVTGGHCKIGDSIVAIHRDGKRERAIVTKVFEFSGLKSGEAITADAGNIVGISGFGELAIGETLCADENREPRPFTELLIRRPSDAVCRQRLVARWARQGRPNSSRPGI